MTLKNFLLPFLLLCALHAPAQQAIGISGYGMIHVPLKADVTYGSGSSRRDVGHTNNLALGVRLEATLIAPNSGAGNRCGFAGIGVAYFAPVEDSSVYTASMGYNQMSLLATTRTSVVTYGVRFGYGIPQEFNEFLTLFVGGGLQLARIRKVNIFPETHPGFTYEQSDFEPEAFEPRKEQGAMIEFCAGGFYELEQFYLTAQYSFFYPVGSEMKSIGRHGLNLGICYPLTGRR
jgi:hypothetical protein